MKYLILLASVLFMAGTVVAIHTGPSDFHGLPAEPTGLLFEGAECPGTRLALFATMGTGVFEFGFPALPADVKMTIMTWALWDSTGTKAYYRYDVPVVLSGPTAYQRLALLDLGTGRGSHLGVTVPSLPVGRYYFELGSQTVEGPNAVSRSDRWECVITVTAQTQVASLPTQITTVRSGAAPRQPGFEAVFAVAGLIAVAYLLGRRKEDG